MAVPKHLDEAVVRLKKAAVRVEAARAKPVTVKNLQQWLVALSDFAVALSDIQSFNNESVHEKLHELAARAGLREFPSTGAKGS